MLNLAIVTLDATQMKDGGGQIMPEPLTVGTSVQHIKFGQGSVTSIRKMSSAETLEIVVQFNKLDKIVTFSSFDFDEFLVITATDTATQPDRQGPKDHNKARLRELEARLRK